mgnify:CR=1 FL=1
MGELLSVAQWAERHGKDARNARRLITGQIEELLKNRKEKDAP